MTNAKVRIDVPAGIVELEGDEGFVTTYLDKLLPFIEAGGFGTGLGQEDVTLPDGETGRDKDTKAPRKRRATKRPPSGASCRDRILILRKDGFFKSEKCSSSDIVTGLGKKGWTHDGNQVRAALTQMFNKGEIQRTQDGKSFKYFYDRPD